MASQRGRGKVIKEIKKSSMKYIITVTLDEIKEEDNQKNILDLAIEALQKRAGKGFTISTEIIK